MTKQQVQKDAGTLIEEKLLLKYGISLTEKDIMALNAVMNIIGKENLIFSNDADQSSCHKDKLQLANISSNDDASFGSQSFSSSTCSLKILSSSNEFQEERKDEIFSSKSLLETLEEYLK
ncbi:MAG: hypothetical protein MHPSP_000899 [Paramarteilia canceri]